jgi:histone H3/H4
MNHREAWCIEKVAPSHAEAADTAEERESSREVLIVASKVKDYLKEHSGLSLGNDAIDAMSDLIRRECDEAVIKAEGDGRKTVMARDFKDWRVLTKRRAAASGSTVIRRRKQD